MDGFKDTTKTQFVSGGKCFAKGGKVVGPRGAAASSKGFAAFKKGAPPVVKKAAGGPVKKSTGGVLKTLLPFVSPLAGAIVNHDPLAMLPGAFAIKKLIGGGTPKPLAPGAQPGVLSSAGAPIVKPDDKTVTGAAKGGIMRKASGGEVALHDAQKLNMPSPICNAKGGPVKKARGGQVRTPTIGALEQANRDTGGLDKRGEAAMKATVARGNRMQAEEAGEDAVIPKTRRHVPAYSEEPLVNKARGGSVAKW